jgi:hypothetical protein
MITGSDGGGVSVAIPRTVPMRDAARLASTRS